ncbi:MAG TPA: hypothetical protein VEL76_07160 [Gemmataceae bacterium]|nr:hypothetical protein [Gemmataceae bacterium]
MALRTTCPNCMTVYELPATQRATKLRCKRCREIFFVAGLVEEPKKPATTAVKTVTPEDDLDPPEARLAPPEPIRAPRRPVPPRDADAPETEPEAAREGSPVMMWLLGIGSLLAVAGIVVLVIILSRGGGNQEQPVAEGPPPGAEAQPPGKEPIQPPKEKVVEQPKVQPPPELPRPVPKEPQPELPPPDAPQVKGPAPRKIAFWKVEVDPPPAAVVGPPAPDLNIPLSAQARLIYPGTASIFVAVGTPAKMSYGAKIWDLQNMKDMGKLGSPFALVDEALSPDGKYFAARLVRKDKTIVEVWSVGAEGQKPTRLEVDPRPAYLALVDFARPGRVVTAKYGAPNATFQIWDIGTGLETGRFETSNFVYKIEAFSPGRRYLAVADKEKIMVHDLAAAKPAGEIELPKGYDAVRGLAFSPDGKELAAYLEQGQRSHLLSWDVAAGEVVREHRWDKGPNALAQKSTLSPPLGLQWLQGQGGWLILGQVLVEHTTGQHAVILPAAVNDPTLGTRRLFGPKHVLTMSGFAGKQQLTAVPLPAAQIASMLNVVREDALAPPLPPAKVATWNGVRLLSPPVGEVPWQAAADPAPAARAAPLFRTALRWQEQQTEQILFTTPLLAQAAVLSMVKPSSPTAPQQLRVDRYDLTSGKFLGGRPLCPVSIDQKHGAVKGDLSPDGTLLLVQHPADGRRLDVWSMAGGKHEAAWMPCATDTEPAGKPRWFAALDGGRVLTLGEQGRLTLWQLPDCRALWTLEGVRGTVALSPGRNYLAAHDGAAFQLLATADGTWKGRQLLSPELAGGVAMAAVFAPDGQTLVANLSAPQRSARDESVLSRWNALNGKVEALIPVPLNRLEKDDRLVIWSQRHVLVGRMVIDWNIRAPVCAYRGPMPRFLERVGLPDGRCWVANDGTERQATLTGRSLPEGEIGTLLTRLAGGQAEVVVAPGAAIAINVSTSGPPTFQFQANKTLTDRLKELGFVPAANAATKVNVHVSEKTNGTFSLFDDKNARVDVPIYELTVTVDVTDGSGKKLKDLATGTFRTRPQALGNVVFGDPVPQSRNEPYARCAQWLAGVTLPGFVVRDGDRFRTLPETADFKMDGP